MRRKLIAFSTATLSSLSIRNYRLYFIGQGISITGTWMQGIGLSWLVLHLTGSGTALGVVAALQCAPMLIIGAWGGTVAERMSKRRLLIITQSLLALFALAIGLAVAFDVVSLPLVFVFAAGLGVVSAIDYPARQTFVHDLVGPEHLASGVGLTSAEINLGRIVGPALASVVIATIGTAACFLLNAVSFLAVIVCLLMMRSRELHRSEQPVPEDATVRAGLVYARRTPAVLAPVLMMAIIGVFTFEFSVSLPLLAKFGFNGDAGSLGWLMSAMGVGAVIGGIITAGRRGDGLKRVAWAAVGFGVATSIVAVAPTLAVAALLMVPVGIFSSRFTALSNTIIQLKSEPQFRSRMMALWSVAFIGSSLVGGPLVGTLGQHFGAHASLAVGVVGGILGGAVGWWGHVATARQEAERSLHEPSVAASEAAA